MLGKRPPSKFRLAPRNSELPRTRPAPKPGPATPKPGPATPKPGPARHGGLGDNHPFARWPAGDTLLPRSARSDDVAAKTGLFKAI